MSHYRGLCGRKIAAHKSSQLGSPLPFLIEPMVATGSSCGASSSALATAAVAASLEKHSSVAYFAT